MNFNSIFSNIIETKDLIFSETLVTIQMVVLAGFISAIIGLAFAIALLLFRPKGLKPNATVYRILSVVINLLRSIPFVILTFALMPITKILVGTRIGFAGSIVPLVFSTFPFFARQFETALLEVSDGVIEAALSMGASDFEIVVHVYLSEALPGLIRASTITLVNLLGLTTMVGVIAGGGVGDLALIKGFRGGEYDIVLFIVVIILVLVYIIEFTGNLLIKITNRGD